MSYRKSHIPDFPALAKKVATAARTRLHAVMGQYAEHTRKDFVERIEDQRFASFRVILYPESGTNLSPQWIERKDAKGADLRTMIATKHYIRSIRVFRVLRQKGRVGVWRVGFDPREKARDLDGNRQKITLDTVALIHEHGNSQTPARPHWGPNLRRLKKEAPAVRRYMRDEIRKAIRLAVGKRMKVGGH